MKQIYLQIVMVLACICVGCGTSNSGEQEIEETEVYSDLEQEVDLPEDSAEEEVAEELDAALLSSIEVEAGSKEILPESFFSEYSGQDLQIVEPLTEEQLRVPGEIYQLAICCNGADAVVEVKIVDTTPPVLEGVKDISVEYGDAISYKKNVTVTDNSGEEIEIQVDAGNVNKSAAGSYEVCYRAEDSSGNATQQKIQVTISEQPVLTEEYVRPQVEQVVNSVVTAEMSAWDKAYALYVWCHDNITYNYSHGTDGTMWEAAYGALKNRSGDCYTYSGTYSALLTVAGIDNMMVRRVGGTSNHRWNLVNIGNGWYHCDTSPRRKGDKFKCFMQTDAQVEAYTASYSEKPNYYVFDASLYPERATEIVFGQ